MNTSAQVGGLLGSIAYGYIVEWSGSYDAPFVPMAALLLVGTLLWFRIDAATDVTAARAGAAYRSYRSRLRGAVRPADELD